MKPEHHPPATTARWRRAVACLVLVGAVAVGGWSLWPSAPEPSVRGRGVTELVRALGATSGQGGTVAEADLRSLGSAAVPVLLRLAARRDSVLQRGFDQLSPLVSARTRLFLWERLKPYQAMEDRRLALRGLGILRGHVPPAALGPLLASPDRTVATAASEWLRQSGPAALPEWRLALGNRDPYVRWLACSGIAGLGEAGAPAAAEVGSLLEEQEAGTRECAVRALGAMGRAGWPWLVRLARTPDEPLRLEAMRWVLLKPAGVLAHVGDLRVWTAEQDPLVRKLALAASGWARPWEPWIEATLRSACADPDPELRLAAVEGIRRGGEMASGMRRDVEQLTQDQAEAVRGQARRVLEGLSQAPASNPAGVE